MNAICPSCEAPQDQGLLCAACCDRLERDLGDVRALMGELDTTISKQARIGASGKGAPARERNPVNWAAVTVADDLTNTLTTWARDVSDRSGWIWVALRTPPAVQSAATLLVHIDAIRRHPAVNELVDEIADAVTQARRAVDRPADKQYFGTCYSETPDPEGRLVTCLEEIYARVDAREVRCKVCGTAHEIRERRIWLMKQARDMLVTVKEASSYLGEVGGIAVTEASIRGFLHRGKRLSYRAPVDAKRFRLGDLLDVLMDESERKSA